MRTIDGEAVEALLVVVRDPDGEAIRGEGAQVLGVIVGHLTDGNNGPINIAVKVAGSERQVMATCSWVTHRGRSRPKLDLTMSLVQAPLAIMSFLQLNAPLLVMILAPSVPSGWMSSTTVLALMRTPLAFHQEREMVSGAA